MPTAHTQRTFDLCRTYMRLHPEAHPTRAHLSTPEHEAFSLAVLACVRLSDWSSRGELQPPLPDASCAGGPRSVSRARIDRRGERDAKRTPALKSPQGRLKWKHIIMNHTADPPVIDGVAYHLQVTVWR